MVVPSILGIGLILLGAALGIVRLTDERPRISDMGQSRPFDDVRATSGLRSETDIVRPAPVGLFGAKIRKSARTGAVPERPDRRHHGTFRAGSSFPTQKTAKR